MKSASSDSLIPDQTESAGSMKNPVRARAGTPAAVVLSLGGRVSTCGPAAPAVIGMRDR